MVDLEPFHPIKSFFSGKKNSEKSQLKESAFFISLVKIKNFTKLEA